MSRPQALGRGRVVVKRGAYRTVCVRVHVGRVLRALSSALRSEFDVVFWLLVAVLLEPIICLLAVWKCMAR